MDLYYIPRAAPSRTVLMVSKALGLELNKKIPDYKTGEHLKPEFLKLNPQHTVPTLVDNGFSLWESRAIITYLVDNYGGENNPLYPSDPKARAVINQRLYFDMGTLNLSLTDYFHKEISDTGPAGPELYKKVETAVDFLNTFLEGQKYAAGNSFTLADIALISTVSTLDVLGFDFNKYPNVAKWYEHTKKITPGWEENWKGALEMKERFPSVKMTK